MSSLKVKGVSFQFSVSISVHVRPVDWKHNKTHLNITYEKRKTKKNKHTFIFNTVFVIQLLFLIVIISEMTMMPRESAKLIAKLSKNVLIEQEGVKNLSCMVLEGLKDRKIHVKNFSQASLHPRSEDPRAIDWIFVLDVLNFSFWPSKGTRRWTVNGESGYFALCAAIKRAIEEDKPILDPKYYANINQSDFEYIFRGDEVSGSIPLMEERIENLREAGQVLNDKYQGTFVECVKSCSGSAEGLLKLIVNEFKSFRDEATYDGCRVSFYKRAQILVGDIWACFEGKNIGAFHDIDYLTMFADYRIPQVLLHFGTIRYSNLLLSKLQSDVELEAGSAEELEIRGCSIEVVEQVKDEVQNLIFRYPELGLNKSDCHSVVIDHFLWDYRRAHAEELENIPFHKTRTIFY